VTDDEHDERLNTISNPPKTIYGFWKSDWFEGYGRSDFDSSLNINLASTLDAN
jgi:hypothetical protein